MELNPSTSVETLRAIHSTMDTVNTASQPSSPRSSALPSPPDSPDSISSFPSLSSSFFFSSAAASPPHSHSHSDHDRESVQELIIPSLTLPAALRPPTAYGKTLGDVRLLVLDADMANGSSFTSTLFEENEDVVDIGVSEPTKNGFVQRASTDWVEQRDAHGLERIEPAHNVEILQLPTYNPNDELDNVVQSIQSIVHGPFHDVCSVIDPRCSPSALLSNLVSSPSMPFYTALIVHAPTLSSHDRTIITTLSTDIPIIVFPPAPGQNLHRAHVSSFRPTSAHSLRAGLFRSPETLATLRMEAADRFLRWREVDRAVRAVHHAQSAPTRDQRPPLYDAPTDDEYQTDPNHDRRSTVNSRPQRWNKAEWEAEWDRMLSHDVARRMREGTITSAPPTLPRAQPPASSCAPIAFDPLHLPSLFMFSLSLLAPLKARIAQVKLSGGPLGMLIAATLGTGIFIGLACR